MRDCSVLIAKHIGLEKRAAEMPPVSFPLKEILHFVRDDSRRRQITS